MNSPDLVEQSEGPLEIRNPKDIQIVFAGGGTAGHIEPALAVADELIRRGMDHQQLHFIGSERGLETRLVPERGYTLSSLPGRGILRSFAWRNIKSASDLTHAGIKSLKLLWQMRPKAVVTVGGYASLPVAAAAAVLHIPILVMEQNSVPGASNLLASKVASVSAVSFKTTDMPRALHTGNPVREVILEIDRDKDRETSRARLGTRNRPLVIGVVGGSLGAKRINEAVVQSLAKLSDSPKLHIHHIIGQRDWPLYGQVELKENAEKLSYRAVEYEKAMHDVYAAVDLLIARAGATTVAEVAVTATPTVFIPLPNAPRDHQRLNADALVKHGAAELINDEDFDSDRFIHLVQKLRDEPEHYIQIGKKAAALAKRDACEKVADLVIETAKLKLAKGSP